VEKVSGMHLFNTRLLQPPGGSKFMLEKSRKLRCDPDSPSAGDIHRHPVPGVMQLWPPAVS
jgi:hypothetical protein